jgi:ribosomal protein S13
MRIEIEIPKEFEGDFNTDKFEEILTRLGIDAHEMAGNYEKETVEMLIEAFKKAKIKSQLTSDIEEEIEPMSLE